MAINIEKTSLIPVRRDKQIASTLVSFLSSGAGSSSGGGSYSSGITYTAGNGISIAGTVISADFGTTSTKTACGSHNHAGIYLPIGGTAVDSDCLGGQEPSYYATASHTHAAYLPIAGCACDAKCFGAQAPSYYSPATHVHGNITAGGCIGGISGCVLVTTTNGCITVASSMPPASHTHGSITNDGKIGTASGCIVVTSTNGCVAAVAPITVSVGCAVDSTCLGGQTAAYYAPIAAPIFTTSASAPLISGGTCVRAPYVYASTCAYAPIFCGTSCVRTPILCATTCSRSAVHCSTTAARAPYFCASTGIISPVIQLTTGAGDGCVLTSDEFGNATWTTPEAGVTYTAGNGICISAGVIQADFGTTATKVSCGSHVHGNISNVGAIGTASGCIVTTTTSGVLTVTTPSSITVGTATNATNATNATCLNGQLASYYATAAHVHGNITAGGCVGTASGCVLVTTTSGCVTVASSATPSSHTHGNITNGGGIGSASGCIVCTTTSGILTTVSPSSVSVGTANNATCLNGQLASYYSVSTHNHNTVYLQCDGCASDSMKLNNKLPAYYATTGHTHGIYALVSHCLAHITGNDRIPIFTCTCRGLVPPPQSCDGQSVLANDGTWKSVNSLSGITDTQYLQFQGYGSGTLTNGSAYYWGNASRLSTSVSLNKVYVPQSGTLRKLYAYGNFGTIGNSCAICMWVVKNGTTCCIIGINCSASASRCWVSTNMSLPITAGDYLEIKTISCAGAGAVYFNATAQLTSEITPFMNSNVSELFFDSAGTPYSINYVCITSNVTWNAYEASPWITLGGCTSGTCNGCFNMTLSENTTELTRYYTVCVIGSGGTGRYIGICQFGCCGECGCYEV